MPKIRRRIGSQVLFAGMMLLIANSAYAYRAIPTAFNSFLSMRMQGTDGDFWHSWSPDGQWIAFDSDRTGNWDIWIVKADSSQMINLTADSTAGEIMPKWSPDGQYISFVSDRSCEGDYCTDLWVMNADGTNLRNLTEAIDGSIGPSGDGYYEWSGDGEKLLVPSYHDLKTQLWLLKLGGTYDRIELPVNSMRSLPSLSPDGTQIVFTKNNVIWILEIDNSQSRQIEVVEDYVDDAFWSPTQLNQLAAVVRTEENFVVEETLVLINLDRDEEVELLTGYQIDSPSWSPDGKSILFFGGVTESSTSNIANIHVFALDGSQVSNLTPDPKDFYLLPIWSPDGSQIAFVHHRTIWVMNSDGSGQHSLTDQASVAQ